MKLGGNQRCQSYLSSRGILPSVGIKQKYESDEAQLYKEILKARAEGEWERVCLFVCLFGVLNTSIRGCEIRLLTYTLVRSSHYQQDDQSQPNW